MAFENGMASFSESSKNQPFPEQPNAYKKLHE